MRQLKKNNLKNVQNKNILKLLIQIAPRPKIHIDPKQKENN